MHIPAGKKIYFASDFHLGLPMDDDNHRREIRICEFLNSIKTDAHAIYLLGDIFDVWFEYKTVIPKGFNRFLGTLAALKDAGIDVHIFTGNHDLWMRDYFPSTLDIPVHHDRKIIAYNDKTFFLAHGDGLGPADYGYKRLKKILRNPFAQWLYRQLHPDIGIRLARYFSRKGAKHVHRAEPYLGDDNEWLVQYAKRKLESQHYDYFIFGHRHLALDISLSEKSRYINLGDWIQFDSYAAFDGHTLELKYYP